VGADYNNVASLALSGNATPADVAAGKTFYSTDATIRETGTAKTIGIFFPNQGMSGTLNLIFVNPVSGDVDFSNNPLIDNLTLDGLQPNTINVSGCTGLNSLQTTISNTTLQSIDLSTCPNMVTLVLAGCTSLSTINIGASTAYALLSLSNCAFDDVQINAILAALVANCLINAGNLDLSGAGNSPPTGQGIIDSAALTTAGWNVTTN